MTEMTKEEREAFSQWFWGKYHFEPYTFRPPHEYFRNPDGGQSSIAYQTWMWQKFRDWKELRSI